MFGNIAIVYDGNPYITINFILKALRTHNNLTLFSNGNMSTINSLLIEIFNKKIEHQGYMKKIITTHNSGNYKEEVIKLQDSFDLIIYIGDKYEYKKLAKDLYVKNIYNGYGSCVLYIEHKTLTDILKKIDMFVYENNISVDIYTNEQAIEETFKEINKIPYNMNLIVITKDKTVASRFIREVKYENIYINKNPFLNYKFKFDEKQLVVTKNIII